MYLYFVLQGKVCDCDVSAIDCSVGLGMWWVRQSDFCGFWYCASINKLAEWATGYSARPI